MSLIFALLAAGSTLSTLSYAAPLARSHLVERDATTYLTYSGNGDGGVWPSKSSWQSLDSLFSINADILSASCAQFGAANNSPQEISALKSAISQVAGETGVSDNYIFAIVMQESGGCVRAPTTNYGVRNPGLMQDHDGQASCNDGGQVNPCPSSTIVQMIRDGTAGTPQGDGLEQLLSKSGDSTDGKYYKAARMYNSGSIAASGNLEDGIATHCYVSDIANRLMGWATAAHTCPFDGASVTPVYPTPTTGGAAPSATTSSGGVSAQNPAPSSSAPLAPGVAQPCQELYTVASGDSCWTLSQRFGFTTAQFTQWNSQVDAQCSNLWLGYQYCVKN